VIGFGNPYHGDDGFGPAVINRLQDSGCPSHVELVEGGILGLDAAPFFEKCDEVILIDAARGGPPGTVDWLDADDVTSNRKELQLTTHGFGVSKLLQVLPIAIGDQALPKIRFLAGWVDDVKVFRQGLSDTAEQTVAKAVALITEDAVWQS